jgi:hypothetical protein
MPKQSLKNDKQTSSSKKITPSNKWYLKQYKENYLNFSTTPAIKDYFSNSKNDYAYLYGSYNRSRALITFGYFLDIDMVNTICITFKIRELKTNIDAIFSFGYFEHAKKTNAGISSGIIPIDTHYRYKYFTTGGSFVSKDGEYRVSLMRYYNIKLVRNTPILLNIFQDIKDYLHNNLTKRGLVITKEFFYPTDDKKSIEVELEYFSYELQRELFVVAWFNLMFKCYLNIVENHLNEKYKKIMFKYQKEDLVFFKLLIKKYSIEKMNTMRYIFNHVFTNKNRILDKTSDPATKIGQKIIPLTISETQNPFNIKYKPWREYLISCHLSNYIINNISPGFFLTNSWFYIKNSRKGLFDNEIQYEKMQRSELAVQITELLSRAQLYTHENIRHKLNKISMRDLNSHISNKFKELSVKIQDPINYAKEDIIMSNVALCMLSEYVGRTIWDVVLLSKSSDYYNNLIGQPFTSSGYPIFAKYMFEMCYNLLCMNKISGVIHGDLHLNNATLNALTYTNVRNINEIDKPQVLYVIGNENNQYVFTTTGYYLCIIDFSRSIIIPEKIEQLRDPSLPKSYKILDNMKEFQLDQVNRLVKLYIHYTSDSESRTDELRIIFKNKFEAVFKLLTSIDIYGATHKLLHMFKLNDPTIIKPHKSCIELLQKINNYAQKYFTVEMNKLINDNDYEKIILEMEWPIQTIIKNCFYEFFATNVKIHNIIDVYNINNPMKYSLNSLEMYPPVLKSPKYIENGVEKNQPFVKKFIEGRKIYEKQNIEGLKVVNFIAVRQKQKHL